MYGGDKDSRAPWLRWLINHVDRERDAYERDVARTCSLEEMVGSGRIDPDSMKPYQGPEGRKTKYTGNPRGRPRKDTNYDT